MALSDPPTRSRSARVTRDLPMPASPTSRRHWPSPPRTSRPALAQQRQFLVAPDHRAQMAAGARLEAAVAGTLALDGKCREAAGPGPCSELRSQGDQVERRPDELLRAVGDDDLSRLRQVLQAGGDVGRVADHGGFLRRALADQVADDHQPGGDAGTRGKRLAIAGPQLGDGADRGQGGAHRPFGLVFMRLRPAEIGQHAVAHELGDIAVEARNLAGHRVLVAPDDLAHLFRIAARRQGRRTDEVDEQHRELAPLGGIDGRFDLAPRGSAARPPAMALSRRRRVAERDAESP